MTKGAIRSIDTPRSPVRIAIVVFPHVDSLDVAGPAQVFVLATTILHARNRRHPGYDVQIVARHEGPHATSSGLRLVPDASFERARDPVDTLLVAGGPGTEAALDDDTMLAWVRTAATSARRIGSVSSGALVLAEVGLLDGRAATTHWEYSQRLAERHPRVRVEHDRIFVRDGRVVTSAGATAGVDLALALVEEDVGSEIALAVARELIVYQRRSAEQSQFSTPLRLQAAAPPSVRDLVAFANENLRADLSVRTLARRVGVTPRHLMRVFRRETGESPGHAVLRLRVDFARKLIEESDARFEDIAAQAGFGSAETMRRGFVRTFGLTPSQVRARSFDPDSEPRLRRAASA
jgi:transcriptional regulator GlxA family with amidase domain